MFAGGSVSWSYVKQHCVSLSTTETEFVSASESAKQVVWLKNLLGEIYSKDVKAILFVDNAGAVRLAKNAGEFHKRSKHIHVRYEYVREQYQDGTFDVCHVAGHDQLSDFLTKGLPRGRLKFLLEHIKK